MTEPARYRLVASVVVQDSDGRILVVREADSRVHGKINLPVAFVACTLAVLGGSLFRWLRTQSRALCASISPRRCVHLGVLLAAALVMHLVFVEWGSGLCKNGGPPPGAWFGEPGEVYAFSVPENLSGQAYVQYVARTAGFETGELIGICIWIGPRFSSMNHGDLFCFAGGIIAPMGVLGAAVFILAKQSTKGQNAGRPT